MSIVVGSVLEEIREAGRVPVPCWMTPYGRAVQVDGKWLVLDAARDISEHPDVEVAE